MPKPRQDTRPLVLLADDFEDAQILYREYLEFFGINIVTAASGEAAVRMAIDRKPALVLLDIRMPGMTGTEAMQEMRRQGVPLTVPIIAFTAHALEAERTEFLAAGFDGFIAKPCLPEDLLAFVQEQL